jgi:hypothetical protein
MIRLSQRSRDVLGLLVSALTFLLLTGILIAGQWPAR